MYVSKLARISRMGRTRCGFVPQLADHRETALPYMRKLGWPHMSERTVQATLRILGRLPNYYRSSWTAPADAKNPFVEVDLPPK